MNGMRPVLIGLAVRLRLRLRLRLRACRVCSPCVVQPDMQQQHATLMERAAAEPKVYQTKRAVDVTAFDGTVGITSVDAAKKESHRYEGAHNRYGVSSPLTTRTQTP